MVDDEERAGVELFGKNFEWFEEAFGGVVLENVEVAELDDAGSLSVGGHYHGLSWLAVL